MKQTVRERIRNIIVKSPNGQSAYFATDEIINDLCEILERCKKDDTKGKGKGCKCFASYDGECGCDGVDWTDYTDYNSAIDSMIKKVRS